jgi:hypothetical protein
VLNNVYIIQPVLPIVNQLTLLFGGLLFSFNSSNLTAVGIASFVDESSFGESDSAASAGRNAFTDHCVLLSALLMYVL